jgi:hypothetical protein
MLDPFSRLAIALGLGLPVGLQRQRSDGFGASFIAGALLIFCS